MTAPTCFADLLGLASAHHISSGPMLAEIYRSKLEDGMLPYLQAQLKDIRTSGDDAITSCLSAIEKGEVRGRAGAGFPVAHKLRMLRTAEAVSKMLVCNAHAFGPSYLKIEALLSEAPETLLLSLMLAGDLSGARRIALCVNEDLAWRCAPILDRWESMNDSKHWNDLEDSALPRMQFELHLLPASYIAGEESSLLNSLSGLPAKPQRLRLGPLLSGPSASRAIVLNLESVLQVAYCLKAGATTFRQQGTGNSPGTMLFNVVGDVCSPGLYEVPLGTTLDAVIHKMAGGVPPGTDILGVLPGGLGSRILTRDQLGLQLDYESFSRAANTMGTGDIIVFSTKHCPVSVTSILADTFRDESCGQCHPCKDGLARVASFLADMERKKDTAAHRQASPDVTDSFRILNNQRSDFPLYTDVVSGADKITLLCEFLKHRGDCSFTVFASDTITSIVRAFPKHFVDHSNGLGCRNEDPNEEILQEQYRNPIEETI